jgi:hypothetical protein
MEGRLATRVYAAADDWSKRKSWPRPGTTPLLLEVLKEIRKELGDQRTLAVLTTEHVRKLDGLTATRFYRRRAQLC